MKENKKTNKSKRVKNKKYSDDSAQNTSDISPDTRDESKENLIIVGGIAGYNEEVRPRLKSFKEFREEARMKASERNNKKNERTRENKTSNINIRQKKIEKLRSDVTHWRGLE